MITRVQLTNFQNHRSLDLKLGRFSVLSGPSNSGKTACLRAIAALLRNDSPNEYVTFGQTDLTVVLTLEDGNEVKWEKGLKGKNQYTLTRPDGSVSEYKKVGPKVPEEVSDVLRIGPLVMEGGDKIHLNLHEQQESPFLIMDTAGQVAKVFGELTSAGKLFSAANEGNRRTREQKKTKSIREADVLLIVGDPLDPTNPGELRQYADVEQQQAALTEVEEKAALAEKIEAAATGLKSHFDRYTYTAGELTEAEKVALRLAPAQGVDLAPVEKLNAAVLAVSDLRVSLATSTEQLESIDLRLPGLREIAAVDLSALTAAQVEVAGLQDLLSRLRDAEGSLATATVPQVDLSLDFGSMEKLNAAITTLDGLFASYQLAVGNVTAEDQHVDRYAADLQEVQSLLADVDSCPMCGQEIDSVAHLTGATHE